ncbi:MULTISPECIES: bifunctional ADP-dependent NAD(P)H-hydrate dehydratase/NAD(P)H-hydrate epimerase [Enterobacter cloacae complex]|jgi:NAD(P)H-hydrate epimerase|uniref:bifunctional ADP-dependent NAD(P)H-hydrate dehydratase/NAD(P)H-hydrate epimerase n=1 Tax=Enterobacter cloacae complex TaxID=354276 RepID=UPI0004BBA81E|nr:MULTISPECIES: bifunctional ADP-dependent NAD(P)H-hydrate dehydratase/NAD(P)H-hydrate epimerase [Enterobacter cloacae complex]MBX9045493.1 bifunctional ADP-dependent NAD(P)H-hydrate dehydratase/NAD(P)H-hydrate epimerase [Enterobacter ludwigii]MBX9082319.1 bifunctional ADP-dependent NAD(P)H-hydrate dehydratase/NAD(P)H-hydrate epimerase [Enterobacter ludwigii]MDP9946058.1 NAD(P)H-hydrate epimerase [Enterobacter ludwigii]MEA3941574.1 bifunctional ADP-dependent NAD(P)H-hydrate dehydratase/NAD(P)H
MTDHTVKKNPESIPHSIWHADDLRHAEKEAADSLGITLYELMQRAGEAAFNVTRTAYPESSQWLILCGHGNNGGDGYVVARLAVAAGIHVTLLALESDKPLPEEASAAREAWLNAGGVIHATDIVWPEEIDVIIDGLLGTGLRSAPRDPVATLIARANAHSAPVVALDIPSGLMAQTGTTPGAVIQAAHTVAFIALKPGLLTGKARDVTGTLHHNALGLESWLAGQETHVSRVDASLLAQWLPPRRPTSHKGDHGRLVIIGGDHGTAGAIRMTGEAALRCGAGLVRVLTRIENSAPIITARPELMVHELTPQSLEESLEWADVVVIGPGLGQQAWGKQALQKVENFRKPMLWDADALNLLAINPDKRHNRILTPHPGEAARLLNCSVAEIESDRLLSARRLVKRYGGVAVLKGAGTVVASDEALGIVDAGNAGMASGGMGDVLSGIIGALLGQKLPLYDAACAGCVAHGVAADKLAARYGTRGMLATDLFCTLRRVVNPDVIDVEND